MSAPVEVEHLAAHAAAAPERPAVIDADGRVTTYGELDARSNQVAQRLWAQGLRTGDHVAVLLENRIEVLEAFWGAMRMGLYVTPINWHLAAGEARFIIGDCGARALIASSTLGAALADGGALDEVELRLVVGGPLAGFEPYEEALAAQPTDPVPEPCEGSWMFYSSGTTGRPKGIKPPTIGGPLGAPTGFSMLMRGLYGFDERAVYLCPAPLYHAAPAGWTTTVHRLGGTAVVMDRFDPVEVLRLVEAHRVTHAQFVPTHLVRMLKLSDEERHRYDLSSLQVVVHAAAPCPVEVKRAVLEWLGPIVHEYYSGSEGAGFCAIGPEEWLAHPGSVGRAMLGTPHVLDPTGEELPPGQEGQLWFEGAQRFEYHGDPVKTAEAIDDRGWATLGDMGRVDEDGYVYLTDRVSNMVISGGVNIYPREVEDVLVLHPQVADVAVVGIPDEEMGEAVRAVVQPVEGATADDALADELVAYCRERLSHFKCPRSVAFVDELPRLPTGKLPKRLLPPEALAP